MIAGTVFPCGGRLIFYRRQSFSPTGSRKQSETDSIQKAGAVLNVKRPVPIRRILPLFPFYSLFIPCGNEQ